MSFDARSLERLQQLGRSLPQPLPKPAAPAPADPPRQQRHRVETETDPEALFRELIQVSPDGTVPEHLLQRLREAEADQQRQRRHPSQPAAQAQSQGQPQRRRSAATKPTGLQQPRRAANGEELELYTAFQQLLLEDDDGD